MFHTLKRDLHRSLFVESANRNMLRAPGSGLVFV